jgi:protoheme IX farnesyltransferase
MINYYLLTKPGIILGNLITFAAGFLLASKGQLHLELFLATFFGLALIMASACVFNNYIDRNLDRKMERTKNRALVKGLISNKKAIVFAVILGFLGTALLLLYTNLLTVFIAGLGFFVYVVIYSFWKSRTIYGTAIGSIAGAVPPVVGYCAVSNQFDMGALILFSMMVLWQMPHFFSIAIMHLEDYTRADIPVLPVKKGMLRTKIHMVIYIIGFFVVSLLLTLFGFTGNGYLIVTATFGIAWLVLCLMGFKNQNDKIWGQNMFRLSLLLITAVSFIIPFDTTG